MDTSTNDGIESVAVVLIDPRSERRTVIRRIIEHCGVVDAAIVDADDGAAALALLEEHPADLVVIEIQMPLSDGLDAIAGLRRRWPDLAIVVCSFHRDGESKLRALAAGADAYLEKPISPDDFRVLFQRLLADPNHRLHDDTPAPEPVPAMG
ncbi:MAG: hypothetical protein QOG64_2547 [Acidimicrobiaceae bacterium]|jgi:CheY-like chemotaxis protein|nr:hypothetical protein [Acidimicrobiaceae bacterium]